MTGYIAWWRHQMETLSALLAICAGNSTVPVEFQAQRPVTRGFDVFFDLRLNKRLSKQWWGWWFETPSCPLWHHLNGIVFIWMSSLTNVESLCPSFSVDLANLCQYKKSRLCWHLGSLDILCCLHTHGLCDIFMALPLQRYNSPCYCIWKPGLRLRMMVTGLLTRLLYYDWTIIGCSLYQRL